MAMVPYVGQCSRGGSASPPFGDRLELRSDRPTYLLTQDATDTFLGLGIPHRLQWIPAINPTKP
jgi:hypothetical protein